MRALTDEMNASSRSQRDPNEAEITIATHLKKKTEKISNSVHRKSLFVRGTFYSIFLKNSRQVASYFFKKKQVTFVRIAFKSCERQGLAFSGPANYKIIYIIQRFVEKNT